MPEGWHGDDYLVIFDHLQVEAVAARYGFPRFLPQYRLVGLRGWDDFIVADQSGGTYKVPTVPLIPDYLEPFIVPPVDSLRADVRYAGKIKWYIKPLVFGGDPQAEDNLAWVDLDQHAQAVTYFNDLYRRLATKEGA